jgi:hypothetical protein
LAVTFWYAWLLNQTTGSVLLTLIAHGTEGAVETNRLWSPGSDLDRLNFVYATVWCLVALSLLLMHRRFWIQTADVDASCEPSARTSAMAAQDARRTS